MDANSLVVGIEFIAGLIAALTVIFGALGWFIDIRNKNSLHSTMNPLNDTLNKIDNKLEMQDQTIMNVSKDVRHGHKRLEDKIEADSTLLRDKLEEHQSSTSIQFADMKETTKQQFDDIKHQQQRQLDYIKEVDAEHEDTKKEVTSVKEKVAGIEGELGIRRQR